MNDDYLKPGFFLKTWFLSQVSQGGNHERRPSETGFFPENLVSFPRFLREGTMNDDHLKPGFFLKTWFLSPGFSGREP